MTLRLIHTADWQIGRVFRFVDNATMGLLQDARLRAVTRLGELAAKQGARRMLVAGEGDDAEHGISAYPLKLFQRVITVSLETMKIVRSFLPCKNCYP